MRLSTWTGVAQALKASANSNALFALFVMG